MGVSMYKYGTQESTSDVIPRVKPTLCFETGSLIETQSSQRWLDRPAIEYQEPSLPTSTAPGLQVKTSIAGVLQGDLEIEVRSSCLCMGHLPDQLQDSQLHRRTGYLPCPFVLEI